MVDKHEFKQIYKRECEKLPKVNMSPGTPGFIDLIRSYNCVGEVLPFLVKDYVFWPLDSDSPEIRPKESTPATEQAYELFMSVVMEAVRRVMREDSGTDNKRLSKPTKPTTTQETKIEEPKTPDEMATGN